MLDVLISSTRQDLSALVFSKIQEDLKDQKQVYLVVPAQSTISIEKQAFSLLGDCGFFNLNIVRGKKLAETILSETSRPGKTTIDTLGRSLLLRNIASKNEEGLGNFSKLAKDSDFLELVSNFISQLKKNGLDSTSIDQILGKSSSTILNDKLFDMKLFTSEYEKLMEGKFTDSDDLVTYTADKAKESKTIKNSVIYYYGFYSFTSKELELLESLEKSSLGLNIALLLGEEPHFAVTRDTLKKLKAKMPGLNETICSSSPAPLLGLAEDKVRLVTCANPYSQAVTIAADIKRQVRENGFSYSDIAVLTGESAEMAGSIKRIFKEFDIPYFADEKRTVLHSSAIEAVKSILDIAIDSYKTLDAIRFIKSGVLDFDQEDVERLENYLKLYHIKEDKFAKPFKYGEEKLGKETFEKLEQMRQVFYACTNKFVTKFNEATTVKEKSLCLYTFLAEEINLPQRLEDLSIMQEEAGLLDSSEESSQVWDVLINLLDQMVELLGPEEISSEDFANLLTSSLADIKVGVLPQSEGKVSVGSVKRSQIETVKAIYLAGINDDIIPSKNDPTGILTPAELETVEKLGFTLAKNSDSLSEEELFSIHKSLSAATDYVFLSYCCAGLDGTDLKPSGLISDIKALYPNLKAEDDIFNAGNEFSFIEGRTLTMQRLSSSLRDAMEDEELNPIWKVTYNLLKDDADELKAGLRYTSKKKPLGKDLATRLFAKESGFSLSPSKLDTFASCPFKYFVNYGLRPADEREFGMDSSAIGSVHHQALLTLCTMLSKASKDGGFAITDPRSIWMTITDEELEQMLSDILDQMKESELDGVMISSKENEYTAKRTKSTCLRFAKHMVEQVRHSVIDEMFFETDFGRKGSFPAIEIETSAGKVFVEGRIDRVDVCPKDESKYVRVIDYKSGSTKFNKDLVSMGLQLQLMVYLQSAIQNYPKDSAGGVYYFHIKDFPASATLEDFPKEELADSVLKQIEKDYKLDGMDVDSEFKANFAEKLSSLCAKLTSGNIDVEPKRYKTLFNSCTYCEYNSICNKDIRETK